MRRHRREVLDAILQRRGVARDKTADQLIALGLGKPLAYLERRNVVVCDAAAGCGRIERKFYRRIIPPLPMVEHRNGQSDDTRRQAAGGNFVFRFHDVSPNPAA